MLSQADLDKIAAAVNDIVLDNSQSLAFRRGDVSLTAQTVRIERRGLGSPQVKTGTAAGESRAQAVMIGTTTLDVEVGDRVTDSNGILYRVTLIHPNRQVCTQANLEVLE